MDDYTRIWKQLLEEITIKVSSVDYDIWFAKIEPVTISYGKLILATNMKSVQETIKKPEYSKYIKDAINKLENPAVTDFAIIMDNEKEAYLSSDNKLENEPTKTTPMFIESYTFDNFIVGNSNNIAKSAAFAVAQNPGNSFNPLFIYGGVGLGKTHILHAIGNYVLSKNPNANIIYATTEQFVNDFVESMRTNKSSDNVYKFREKYRNADILMLDDVQFLIGKEGSQEALFHTFNDLYQAKKQIVLTSYRHPRDLSFLEDRLKSRFQSGLTADISTPDLETRIAILQKKAFQKNFNISKNIIYFIAEKITSNIREIEGALSKVIFYCQLNNKDCADDLDLVMQALKDELDINTHVLSMDTITDTVCSYYSITKDDIKSSKKTKNLAEARQIDIYLINEMLACPLTAIGEYLGHRDHSTIIYARDKITDQIKTNNRISSVVKDIRNMIEKN